MKVLRVQQENPSPSAIARAAEVIRGGGIVGFPTETVYGLGGNALDREAVARIFAAKGRPSYNPLIVHCAETEEARRLARAWPEAAERLAARFGPGPLTLVVGKSPVVPDEVTAGLPTVGLRVPDHPVARALLRAAGVPIAAPSANRFTELSPTTAAHVAKGLGDRIDLLLDAGPTGVGIESTVIDVARAEPVLLRPGSIELDLLEAVVGKRLLRPGKYGEEAARPGPGMLDRHYSPRARLLLVPAGDRATLAGAAAEHASGGARVGALLRTLEAVPGIERLIRMSMEPADYAQALYASLHQMDDEGCDVVLVEAPPDDRAWAGPRDRLARAATALGQDEQEVH